LRRADILSLSRGITGVVKAIAGLALALDGRLRQ
jgi:hypothetical protein